MSEALAPALVREAPCSQASPAEDVMALAVAPVLPAEEPAARETFALAAFLARWNHAVRYDLATSDSETLPLASLLALARADDLERWNALGLGYADPRGAPWLRTAIAGRHAAVDPDDVVVCAGAQEAVSCVARALLGPEDHAVVVLPIYQPSEQAVTGLCAATGVSMSCAQGWRLDVDRVAGALRPDTKLVLTNFPNSPTGATLDATALSDLVALCRRHGLWLVNDEVYRQTDCGEIECPPAVADAYERGVSINGLSKGFGLPGLRVGWVACRDRPFLARVLAAKGALSSCVAGTSEVLAHIALRAEDTIVGRTRAIGQRNRRRLQAMLDRLPEMFEADSPRNLAFAFPRYRGPEGCDRLAMRLARDAGLLLLPGSLWASPLGSLPPDYVRIGLGHASSGPALDALEEYLGRRPEQRTRVASS